MQLMKRPKERKRLSMKKNYTKKKLKQNLRFVGLTFQFFDVFLLNILILVLSSLLYSCYSCRYPLKCTQIYLEGSWIMSNLELLWCLLYLLCFLGLHFCTLCEHFPLNYTRLCYSISLSDAFCLPLFLIGFLAFWCPS